MRTFSIGETARRTGVPISSLKADIKAATVPLAKVGAGRHDQREIGATGVLAFGVGNLLQNNFGVTGEARVRVMKFIAAYSDEELEAQFAKPGSPGILLVIPGRTAMPEFTTRDVLADAPMMRRALDHLHATPIGIDVAAMYGKLKSQVEKDDKAAARTDRVFSSQS